MKTRQFLIYVKWTNPANEFVLDEYRLVKAKTFNKACDILTPEYGNVKIKFYNQTIPR